MIDVKGNWFPIYLESFPYQINLSFMKVSKGKSHPEKEVAITVISMTILRWELKVNHTNSLALGLWNGFTWQTHHLNVGVNEGITLVKCLHFVVETRNQAMLWKVITKISKIYVKLVGMVKLRVTRLTQNPKVLTWQLEC